MPDYYRVPVFNQINYCVRRILNKLKLLLRIVAECIATQGNYYFFLFHDKPQ